MGGARIHDRSRILLEILCFCYEEGCAWGANIPLRKLFLRCADSRGRVEFPPALVQPLSKTQLVIAMLL